MYTKSQTRTYTKPGLSCYGVQGYGSQVLFGLVCGDFLALSDCFAGDIVVPLNFLPVHSYHSVMVCVCVCVPKSSLKVIG